MLSVEERKERRREAVRRHRAKNPEKVRDRARRAMAARYAEDPGTFRERSRIWARDNPEKARARSARWAKNNPEKVKQWARRRWLKANFDLTQGQWEAMFAAQGRECAVCGTDDPGKSKWHTDHCHRTGKLRGILCARCNLTLGRVEDNPSTLDLMAQYLRHHS